MNLTHNKLKYQANGKLFVSDDFFGGRNTWVLDSDGTPELLYKSDDLVIKQCLEDSLLVRNDKSSYVDGQYVDESRTFLRKFDSKGQIEIKDPRGSWTRFSQLDGDFYFSTYISVRYLRLQSIPILAPTIEMLLQQ